MFTDDPVLSKIDQAMSKEAFAGLMTFLLEAARTDADATGLGYSACANIHLLSCVILTLIISSNYSSALEDCKFAPDRMEALQTLYTVMCGYFTISFCDE